MPAKALNERESLDDAVHPTVPSHEDPALTALSDTASVPRRTPVRVNLPISQSAIKHCLRDYTGDRLGLRRRSTCAVPAREPAVLAGGPETSA
jgi:hypothetical protein